LIITASADGAPESVMIMDRVSALRKALRMFILPPWWRMK